MRSICGLLLVIAAASPAGAQQPPTVSLTAAGAPRWDAGGYVGWRGGNKSDIAPEWNQWYDSADFGASAGYYWTTHLKVDFGLSTTTAGAVFVQENIPAPGKPFPITSYGEYRFRTTSLTGGLLYQFGENAWFHPFLGGGVGLVREHARLEFQSQLPCDRFGCAPPLPLDDDDVSYRALPFATAGFKWYMTPRAFVRSEVSTAFSRAHVVDAVTWRIGIGADF